MLPAAHRGEGENICEPDVCLTPPSPPIPIPYTNVAAHGQAVDFSPNVYICNLNALHLMSTIPTTSGDDPGTFGPGPKEVGVFMDGNPIVFVNMLPGINLTCPAGGNDMNAEGGSLVPDVVNVFYSYATEPPPDGSMRAEGAVALRASLAEAAPPRGAMLEQGIGHLRVSVFTADVSTCVYNEIQRLTAEGMRALILDLRSNPGGQLDACLRLAEDFLPEGAILARTVDDDGDETIHRGRRERPYAMPVAVLVDRRTASAAELFAGCLQAHGRAVLVGETTYGKGSAQRMVSAADGVSVVYVTVARCSLPDGAAIDGLGVRPDVEVSSGDALHAAWEAARRGLDQPRI
jgi:carboxyl-terminal processing protease